MAGFYSAEYYDFHIPSNHMKSIKKLVVSYAVSYTSYHLSIPLTGYIASLKFTIVTSKRSAYLSISSWQIGLKLSISSTYSFLPPLATKFPF